MQLVLHMGSLCPSTGTWCNRVLQVARRGEGEEKCFALVRNTVSSSIIFMLLPLGINAHEFIKTKRLLYLQEYENSLFLTRMQIAVCVYMWG